MKVAKKLEAIQSRCFWCDDDGDQKYHLMKWEDIKKPVKQGGLGIRSMVKMNEILHGKWLWRYLGEEDRL